MTDSAATAKLPDEELVRRVQEDPDGPGGEDAAAELYRRYQGQVYLWCIRRVRNHERALDLAQDVLLSAHRALGSFAGRARYSSWLFTIMRNRCFRDLRTRAPWVDDEIEPDLLASGQKSPELLYMEQAEEDVILDLVRRVLEPREQLALWLRCFEDLSVEEITRRLQIPGAAGARAVLQGARRKLRAALAKGGPGGRRTKS